MLLFTFCSSGTEREIWFFPFIAGDGTGSVLMLMTNIPLSADHPILRLWICSHLAVIPFLSTELLREIIFFSRTKWKNHTAKLLPQFRELDAGYPLGDTVYLQILSNSYETPQIFQK